MNGWMKNLVGYMMIISVVTQMMPKSKYEQYVKLFTGLLLIVIILQPILKIGSVDSLVEQKITEFIHEQEMLERNIGMQSEILQQQHTQEIGIKEIQEIQVEVNLDD